MIALSVLIAAAIALGLSLVRALLGPTQQDRLLALCAAMNKCALLAAGMAVLTANSAAADIAVVFVLVSVFVGVAHLKATRSGSFQPPMHVVGDRP